MAALTKGRDTKRVEETRITLPVLETCLIFEGAIVVVNSDGFACPGITQVDMRAIGRADERADNLTGVDGAITVKVSKGAFWYVNSDADPVTLADINMNCYIVDDQTVARTSFVNTRSIAGRVVNVDATLGVCVELGKPGIISV